MESTDGFVDRSRKIATRFLQTAVIVDDEAYMPANPGDGPQGEVVTPGRHTSASGREDRDAVGRGSEHTLDAASVMDSFSTLGVICGVVGPIESATEMMRQADIVVLDWMLQEDDPRYALKLLHDLLTGDEDRNSLRLVVIYTGEARLEEIYGDVFDQLKKDGLGPNKGISDLTISYRHGRVVLYAKSGVNLAEPLKELSLGEGELPRRLVDDFAEMTEGLLPGIVLASLTAVREGEHKVLDQFCTALDPALLAHRACLSTPEDAERQMVNHIAEELRGLMDNAVAEQSPAGTDAVENWIRRRSRGASSFKFGKRSLDLEQTINLARNGLEASGELKNNAFEGLSAGFAGSDVVDLDERLAWIMSFRTVYNAPSPTLWLGTVVTTMERDTERHLICLRPRCDCVRLDEETLFIFLPLVKPRNMEEQLIVKFDNGFERLGIGFDPAGWILRKFEPAKATRAVTATREEADNGFEFTDTRDKGYTWRGELKAEYAQRVAQTFATKLSRVAVDESEWLRRKIKKGL